jgi:signal transduction histidine kinase
MVKRLLVSVAFAAGTLVAGGFAVAAEPGAKSVLAIYAGPESHPANLMLDAALEKALGAPPEVRIDFLTEYLEVETPGADATWATFGDYLERKYAGRHFDVVIAPSDVALKFVLANRARLFPDAAIVWSGVALPDGVANDASLPITGVHVGVAYLETLKLALALHPATEQVLIVAKTLDGMVAQSTLEAGFAEVKDRVRLTYISKPTVQEMLDAVKAAPPRSLVLYLWHQPSEWSNFIFPDTVAKMVADASPVPVYGTHDSYMGLGVVGGVVRLTGETGMRMGAMTRQILDGVAARAIPLENARLDTELDWRQLRRWNISAALIPAGADIRFKTPSVWEAYRSYLIAIAIVLAAQLALIAALLAERSHRRRAEKVIKARESALRTSYSQIRRLASRLLQAQESARSGLARDLHDDFCQKLALVGIGITSLKRSPASVQDPTNQHALSELEQRTQGLFDDVRRLSHDLHPTSLRVLGLGPALSAHIAEMERSHGVRIAYQAAGDLTHLDPDVSVCLFRLAQEAVRNGVNHGRAQQFSLNVTRVGDVIEMTVTDDGDGFDLEAVRDRGGLGLVSMEERAHGVGGTFEIITAVGEGTIVRVRCPAEIQEKARVS